MIKMSRKAKKAMAVALTAGMLASTAVTPVMAATQGWKQNSKGWWYQNADGSYPANKWSQINGKWYYFDANGYMLANSWVKDSKGKWYFVGKDGAMKTNAWAQDKDGLWYWLTDNGSMYEGGWAKINSKWYFFKNDGVMQSGVITVDGKTYYMGASTDGAMKTGEINIAGTNYTFDNVNGDCTSENAPAADKHFDKKGNEIIPTIEVEKVAGLTAEITNALPGAYKEYGNVLISGNDAYLKVLVTDENGKPVANTAVSVMSKMEQGSSNDFGLKSLNVQTTDAYGYATFVFGAKKDEITPTSGKTALIKITATAVSTNQSKEMDLAFACVNTGSIDVLNDNDKTDALLEKNSKNSQVTDSIVARTWTVKGEKITEYVNTQQVSATGSTENKVELTLNPQIEIPVKDTKEIVDKYYMSVDKKIEEYSVYQDGGNTSFLIEDVPAGLLWANLNFSSIDISEHTKLEIIAYAANSDTVIKRYSLSGPTTQKNFTYQIPVQENTALDIKVQVISEGQVDDDQNAGVYVKDIEGVYNTEEGSHTVAVPLENSVTWTTVTNKYSEAKTLDYKEALRYLPDGIEEKYSTSTNKYTYQVPAFPYTGNAIMTVTDVNNKVVGYFTIPTQNIFNDATNDAVRNPEWQNENDIIGQVYSYGGYDPEIFEYEENGNFKLDKNGKPVISPKYRAILVSKDEAFSNVGTIEATGNKVVVNSEKTGVTAIQAKIEVPGFEDEIDISNDTIYTSVHWSPLPKAVSANAQFYALVGQNITVKAQLVDKNGNAVSVEDEKITFQCAGNTIPGEGVIGDTFVNVIQKDPDTDANGQAVLKLNAGDKLALLESLTASSASYDVQLTIDGNAVSKADLRWVEAGLSFISDVDNSNGEYVQVTSLKEASAAATATLKKTLQKDTGSNWILGYEVIGLTQDTKKVKDDNELTNVLSIEGLKVELSKDGKGTMDTKNMANGVAKLTSNQSGATTLTGKINEKSLVSGTDVWFNVDLNNNGYIDGDFERFKNVGEGEPNIDESLDLPIFWGTVGENLSLFAPKGTNFVVSNGDKAYVKVTDDYGEAINNKDVELTISYTLKDGSSIKTDLDGKKVDESITKPSKNGLIAVSLKEYVNTPGDITSVTITAKYDNIVLDKNNVITYKNADSDAVAFQLVDAVYVLKSGSNPQVKLFFTNTVNEKTVRKEMFLVTAEKEGVTYQIPVSAVTTDKNTVTLTFADQYKSGLENLTTYTVTVDGTVVNSNIAYDLSDTNGGKIPDAKDEETIVTVTFDTADTSESDANKAVTAAIEALKKKTVTE